MSGEKKDAAAASGPRIQYQGGKLFLDKEGRWFHDGVEITHKLTADLFSRSLERDPAGGYRLVVGPEWSPVEVEDTPFMVKGVEFEESRVLVKLNDGSEEDLDLASLWAGADNVLYCLVKLGDYPARFLRPAYYQLMEKLVETEDGFAVSVGGKEYPIRTAED